MIKQEIIEKISKYFKLTSFEAEKIYDDIFSGIIKGVKEENIADVTNLGEFIIKYNSGDDKNKKTVEFLPTLSLEEEINQHVFENNPLPEQQPKEPEPVQNVVQTTVIPPVPPVIQKAPEIINEEISSNDNISAVNSETDKHMNVEDEIKRKRDEILSKMIKPKDELKSTENNVTPVVSPIAAMKDEKIENINKSSADLTNNADELNSEAEKLRLQAEELTNKAEALKKKANELSSTSFSDYFTETQKTQKSFNTTVTPPPVIESTVIPPVVTVIPPVETVIPPGAVELHNQITGDINKTNESQNNEYQTTISQGQVLNGNGNGNGNQYEHKLNDNSYYIWYKDSEPNASDTQTMSYEYELLYQATKDAEYKSKLRIYVTTFIIFFSIVLILLIFSPVIYKYFFSPSDDTNTEQVQNETSSTDDPQSNDNNQASVNSLDEQKPANNNSTAQQQNTGQENSTKPVNSPPVTDENKNEQPADVQGNQNNNKTDKSNNVEPKQQVEAKNQQQSSTDANQQKSAGSHNLTGVQKTSMGWVDVQNKVIYVQLESGKFTIQESAWDSDAKANKRINSVGTLIPGLKGNVQKVDLGGKGTWYRARFGEFATLDEAYNKAAELRSREKNRLTALLFSFLMYG